MVKTYSSRTESIDVKMDGMACGWNRVGETCVRETVCGRFAVIADKGSRLFKVLADRLHARRYNFAMHGMSLGE